MGIGADETPTQIRDKLQTLKADERLDSSAVKNCLTTDLKDVDLAKLDEKFQATDSGKELQRQAATISTERHNPSQLKIPDMWAIYCLLQTMEITNTSRTR